MIENLYGVPKSPLADSENGTPLFNPGLRQVIAQRITTDNAARAAAEQPDLRRSSA